jgi:hypothetical protein
MGADPMTFDVAFIDKGHKAVEKPDPKYPDGTPVNLAPNAVVKTCCRNLPYPAPRCGFYVVTCRTCGFDAIISVAGRPDDPRTITLPCKGRMI